MQEYIRYELEYRKYSSNVVIGIYEYLDDNGKTKEKRDIIICPTLRKEDGDTHAALMLEHLSKPDLSKTFTELKTRGFLCEIVTDGWANWKFFGHGSPDYDSARPLYEHADMFDSIRQVRWRGCFWYFDKDTKRLQQDDCGCYENVDGCIKSLLKTYDSLVEKIDKNAFNNPTK